MPQFNQQAQVCSHYDYLRIAASQRQGRLEVHIVLSCMHASAVSICNVSQPRGTTISGRRSLCHNSTSRHRCAHILCYLRILASQWQGTTEVHIDLSCHACVCNCRM